MLVCSECGDTVRDGDQCSEGQSVDAPCLYIGCDGTYRDAK